MTELNNRQWKPVSRR